MAGITRDQAIQAVQLGWGQQELLAFNRVCKQFSLTVPEVHEWWMAVGDRYLIYRGGDPNDLAMALTATDETRQGQTLVYTDGSGTTAEKGAGVGVAVFEPGRAPRYIAEHVGKGTNNRAELCALLRALRAVPDVTRKILVRSDSEYVIGSSTKPWSAKYNVRLIEVIKESLALRNTEDLGLRVQFEHVDGHSGEPGNESADLLSKIGRKYGQKFEYPE